MKLTPKTSQIIRRAMDCARGDDLERANRAFGKATPEQLDKPYGDSGKTAREIWNAYKEDRANHDAAMKELQPLLS